jgi:hypothetical protein
MNEDEARRDRIIEDEEEEVEEVHDGESPRAQLSYMMCILVKSLLEEHPELINEPSQDEYRRLPLHEAIVEGAEVGVIRHLLERGPLSARQRAVGEVGDEEHDAAKGSAMPRLRDDDNIASGDPAERGFYPLHLALTQDNVTRPDILSLVKVLVGAFPEALQEPTPRRLLFPLNLALDSAWACPDVVQYVFETYPAALVVGDDDAMGVRHPLHRKLQRTFKGDPSEHLKVVQFLAKTIPHVLSERDQHGRLPLHYAAKDNVPLVVAKYVLEQHPGAVHEADGSRLVPFQYGVKYGTTVEHLRMLSEAWPDSISANDDGEDGYTPLHRAVNRRDIQWDVLRCLAEAAPGSAHVRSAHGGLLPLHVAVSSPSIFKAGEDPLELAQYVVDLWPEAVLERDDDNANGELPIHRAIRLNAPLSLVEFLFERCPESVWETDAKGRLPLHLAAARTAEPLRVSYLLWDDYPATIRVRDRHGRLSRCTGRFRSETAT